MKRWKGLLLTALLLCSSVSCMACGEETEGSAVSSVATLSGAVSDTGTSSAGTGVVGEYLSVEGDGEIMKLNADGTFLTFTVSDMGTTNSAGGTVTMTESVEGTYHSNEDGSLSLKIRAILLKVEGLEEEPEMVAEYAELMAGDDEELYAAYEKMFGGTEIGGDELYGEDDFARLIETEITIQLDKENSTFTYHKTE